MKSYPLLFILAVVVNNTCGAPIQNIQNGNSYLLNNFALNNLVPAGFPSAANANIFANANHLTMNKCANPILEPIVTPNVIANSIIANEIIGNLPNTIASATIVPNNLANIEFTNVQFTPLAELMPTLQFGDITVAGDLPIGGTIKVCGCIPVYGMITLDGIVPSTGTAVVAESFGNQIADGIPKCNNQYIS